MNQRKKYLFLGALLVKLKVVTMTRMISTIFSVSLEKTKQLHVIFMRTSQPEPTTQKNVNWNREWCFFKACVYNIHSTTIGKEVLLRFYSRVMITATCLFRVEISRKQRKQALYNLFLHTGRRGRRVVSIYLFLLFSTVCPNFIRKMLFVCLCL